MGEDEFRSLSTYGPIKGADLLDWPIGLSELCPYYERAEKIMGVTGTNGRPRQPVNNNYKVMHAGATEPATNGSVVAGSPSMPRLTTVGRRRAKMASPSRAIVRKPNGARPTSRYRAH